MRAWFSDNQHEIATAITVAAMVGFVVSMLVTSGLSYWMLWFVLPAYIGACLSEDGEH